MTAAEISARIDPAMNPATVYQILLKLPGYATTKVHRGRQLVTAFEPIPT